MKSKKTISNDDLRIIRDYRLMDDSFMEVCFSENKKAVELVLGIILGRSLNVIKVITQDSYKNLHGRSIRIDVLAVDEDGVYYNIEIQRSDKGGSPKRARCHSGIIDAAVTEPGEDFNKLPEQYIIFITERDIPGRGMAVYEYVYTEKQLGIPLGDGTHILYVNNEFRDDSDIGKLMQDFAESDPDKMYYDVLAETARYFKESERGVEQMCRVLDMKFEQGYEKGAANMLSTIMQNMNLTEEQVIKALNITPEEYANYKKLASEMRSDA